MESPLAQGQLVEAPEDATPVRSPTPPTRSTRTSNSRNEKESPEEGTSKPSSPWTRSREAAEERSRSEKCSDDLEKRMPQEGCRENSPKEEEEEVNDDNRGRGRDAETHPGTLEDRPDVSEGQTSHSGRSPDPKNSVEQLDLGEVDRSEVSEKQSEVRQVTRSSSRTASTESPLLKESVSERSPARSATTTTSRSEKETSEGESPRFSPPWTRSASREVVEARSRLEESTVDPKDLTSEETCRESPTNEDNEKVVGKDKDEGQGRANEVDAGSETQESFKEILGDPPLPSRTDATLGNPILQADLDKAAQPLTEGLEKQLEICHVARSASGGPSPRKRPASDFLPISPEIKKIGIEVSEERAKQLMNDVRRLSPVLVGLRERTLGEISLTPESRIFEERSIDRTNEKPSENSVDDSGRTGKIETEVEKETSNAEENPGRSSSSSSGDVAESPKSPVSCSKVDDSRPVDSRSGRRKLEKQNLGQTPVKEPRRSRSSSLSDTRRLREKNSTSAGDLDMRLKTESLPHDRPTGVKRPGKVEASPKDSNVVAMKELVVVLSRVNVAGDATRSSTSPDAKVAGKSEGAPGADLKSGANCQSESRSRETEVEVTPDRGKERRDSLRSADESPSARRSKIVVERLGENEELALEADLGNNRRVIHRLENDHEETVDSAASTSAAPKAVVEDANATPGAVLAPPTSPSTSPSTSTSGSASMSSEPAEDSRVFDPAQGGPGSPEELNEVSDSCEPQEFVDTETETETGSDSSEVASIARMDCDEVIADTITCPESDRLSCDDLSGEMITRLEPERPEAFTEDSAESLALAAGARDEVRSDGSDSGLGSEMPGDSGPAPAPESDSETSFLDRIPDDILTDKEKGAPQLSGFAGSPVTSVAEPAPQPALPCFPEPPKSNLKRRLADCTDGEPSPKRTNNEDTKKKRSIQFDAVTVYYFPRAQGFTCVPSQGGSTLGMSAMHTHAERFSLTEHAAEQRRLHRARLAQLRTERAANCTAEAASSSEDPSDDTDEEPSDNEELDIDSYYFLQPVPTWQRRALLRAAGVRRIDAVEKDECRDIRASREHCGCGCKGYCDPESCPCSRANVKCQVDRAGFPCGCSRDGCANSSGRIEFNPMRVRTHFIHTLMRLELEKKQRDEERDHEGDHQANRGPLREGNLGSMMDSNEGCVNGGGFTTLHYESPENSSSGPCQTEVPGAREDSLDLYAIRDDCYPSEDTVDGAQNSQRKLHPEFGQAFQSFPVGQPGHNVAFQQTSSYQDYQSYQNLPSTSRSQFQPQFQPLPGTPPGFGHYAAYGQDAGPIPGPCQAHATSYEASGFPQDEVSGSQYTNLSSVQPMHAVVQQMGKLEPFSELLAGRYSYYGEVEPHPGHHGTYHGNPGTKVEPEKNEVAEKQPENGEECDENFGEIIKKSIVETVSA
ncbi:uncharacterized protein LOC105700216 [Orussus abietinus]|uniref:uncharacterized protein LOC105700216 n=1 Tax=Orussus abietinus TaxID=222816 RepID=UPI0006266878|nr:uncharacterized protein LOC105700216 [Orussus abietinus]